MMTPSQLTTLKTDIAADGTLNALAHTVDNAAVIRDAYNALASPDFWVLRTAIPITDIYARTTGDGTTWSWTAYIARSAAERDAWREMTASGTLNAALPNTPQGVGDIFSGAGGAAQRTHILAIARRTATRAEKLFRTGTGTGSTAAPATMGLEGAVSIDDIQAAWSS